MRLRVEVPATVANLGPGFDCFGLAVGLANTCTVDTEAESRVVVEGEGAGELPEDGSNLVVRGVGQKQGVAVFMQLLVYETNHGNEKRIFEIRYEDVHFVEREDKQS